MVLVAHLKFTSRNSKHRNTVVHVARGVCCCALLCVASIAYAATPEIQLIIKDHLFFPSVLEIPAGQKVRVRIINQDPTAEEFESFELNREKLVVGNGEVVVFIGPLEPGEYVFFGEFYPKTAQGVVVVK